MSKPGRFAEANEGGEKLLSVKRTNFEEPHRLPHLHLNCFVNSLTFDYHNLVALSSKQMIVKLFSVLFAIIITLHSQQNVTFYISIVEHIASMHGKNATPHVHQHVSINAYKKLRSKKQNSHGNLPKHSHDLELVSLDMPSLKLELTCEIINHCRYTVIHNTFRHITSTYLHQYTLEIFRPPVA